MKINRFAHIESIFLCLSVFFLTSCTKISYRITNAHSRWPSQIAKNQESFEKIKNDGSAIYIDFNDICSTTNQPFSILVFSLEEFEKIDLKDMCFIVEEKKINIRFNKRFVVKSKKADFTVEDSPELKCEGYEYFLWRDEHKRRVDFAKVFKDSSFSVENKYYVKAIVNYCLDSKNYSQEITYRVLPYETEGSSKWIYTLFPEVGI